MTCPCCLKSALACYASFRGWEPGQWSVCHACGVVLRVNDAYALVEATPEEVSAQPAPLFRRLLAARCRALQRKISARSAAPGEVAPASAVERPARSGLLFQ